tara:strand:+ start:1828 stop:2127 length:300 start_codon:yes stop_codon:yes gene_type:complete
MIKGSSQARSFIKATPDGVLINRVQDTQPIIEDVKARQLGGLTGSSDMRHVCRVPVVILEEACKAAGVEASDREAVREIIFKKVSSGEWSKFQVHAGGY